MEKATIPLIAFTSDTVAKLTKLSIRQLHYWDRTEFFVPSFADPNRRRPHSRVYSFTDLVALRTIATLLERGATWPDLKRVRSAFQENPNADWASRRFYMVERRVYFTHEEAIVAARPLGQSVNPTMLELGPIVKDVKRAVQRLPQRPKEQIGEITRDRLIMGGQDIIAGTRIPTATIDWFHRNGYSLDEIKQEFPRLTDLDLERALMHEATKRVRAAERIAATG